VKRRVLRQACQNAGSFGDVLEIAQADPGGLAPPRSSGRPGGELPDHRVPGEEPEAHHGPRSGSRAPRCCAASAREKASRGWCTGDVAAGAFRLRRGCCWWRGWGPTSSLLGAGKGGRDVMGSRPPYASYWLARIWLTCVSAVESSLPASAFLLVRTPDITLSRTL